MVAEGSKPNGLRSDPASAVENPCGTIKAVVGKDLIQKDGLFLRCSFPVGEELVILRG